MSFAPLHFVVTIILEVYQLLELNILFMFHLLWTQDYQVIDKVWIIKDKHGPEAWEPDEEETIDVGKVSELHVTSMN